MSFAFFRPSIHGFRFDNNFRREEVLTRFYELYGPSIHPGIDNTVKQGIYIRLSGGAGLCGGMSWTALDHYYNQQPLDRSISDPPRLGDSLFDRLVQRQYDSLRPPSFLLILELYTWSGYGLGLRPVTDTPYSGVDSIGKLTEDKEWPRVKNKLDQGLVAPLCLFRTRDIKKMYRNHQVLAYGYRKTGNEIKLWLYDPNEPNDDNQTITFHLNQNNHDINISQSNGKGLLGFFLNPYDRNEVYISPEDAQALEEEDDLEWLPIVFD